MTTSGQLAVADDVRLLAVVHDALEILGCMQVAFLPLVRVMQWGSTVPEDLASGRGFLR